MIGLLFLLSALTTAAPAEPISRTIDRLLEHPNLRGASIGVEILSLGSGEALYARNAREPLIVASNNKLVSTASALFHLGEEYMIETALHARGNVKDGVLHGDLVIRGGGDPCLSGRFFSGDDMAPLRALAGYIAANKITRVEGDLLLDDRCFDRVYIAPQWPADQLCYYYCAPVAGLSFMENVIRITVTPAKQVGRAAAVSLFPAGTAFFPRGTIRTVAKKGKNAIHVSRPDSDGALPVRGETWNGNPPWSDRISVSNPPLYFGSVFLHELLRLGIVVKGRPVLVKAPVAYGEKGCRRLGAISSHLSSAVMVTNKESHNNCAEHLFKLAGWKVTGKGTFGTGAEAVRRLFDGLGVKGADPFTIVDGSGLSRGNRFSAHTLAALMAELYDSPLRDTFIRSLPISGTDGNMEKRLTEGNYNKRVRAKTGWIREVSALTGFIQATSGEVYSFSILFNGYKGRNSEMKKIQDNICRAVIDNG